MSQAVDYEGYNQDEIPQDLFIPGVHENLWKFTKKGDNCYIANAPLHPRWGRGYGGTLVAVSIAAAIQSLPKHLQHKFYLYNQQSYFLRSTDDISPIEYRVNILKQSKAYLNMRVEAYQKPGQLAFICLCSFVSITERNTHQHSCPPHLINCAELPNPEDLHVIGHHYLEDSKYYKSRGDEESVNAIPGLINSMVHICRPIMTHGDSNRLPNDMQNQIDPITGRVMLKRPTLPRALYYVKWPQGPSKLFNIPNSALFSALNANINNNDQPVITTTAPETTTSQLQQLDYNKIPLNATLQDLTLLQHLNIVALAFISDFLMVTQLVKPHADIPLLPKNVQLSSLNHNLNIITPNFNLFDDWLIWDASCPYLAYSRGQLMGIFYRRDGTPIAMITQQVVARVHDLDSSDISSKFPNPYAIPTSRAVGIKESLNQQQQHQQQSPVQANL